MGLKTIIDKETGREIGATYSEECLETEVLIPELRTEAMENPHFNFETRQFYEQRAI